MSKKTVKKPTRKTTKNAMAPRPPIKPNPSPKKPNKDEMAKGMKKMSKRGKC